MNLTQVKNIYQKKPLFFQIIALAIVILVCYGNILNSPFLWDDEEMVINNPVIRKWEYIPTIFTSSAFGNKFKEGKFYRPIQIFSYLVDFQFWKLNTLGYHLSNIFIHFGSTILLLFLFRFFQESSYLSFIGACIFAVHPIAIEAVTYISGRGDALSIFFALLIFVLFLLAAKKNNNLYFFLAAISYFISILSKENSVPLPIIIAAYVILNKNNFKNATTIIWLGTLNLIMFSYVGFRLFSLGLGQNTTLSYIATASLFERVLTLPRIIITYLKIFILPINLHMEYHFVEKSLASPFILLGLPLIALLLFLTFFLIKNKKAAAFYVLWFFISLGMVYNIPIALASTIREHWLYLPQIGLIGILLLLIPEFIERKRSLAILAITTLLTFWSIYTINRNMDWRSPISLYEHDLKLEPNSFLLYNNLGVELYRKKKYHTAKEAFVNSIQTSPGKAYGTAYNNLGVIIENEGKTKQALQLFKQSIDSSNYYLAYNNLGRLLIKENKPSEAIPILKKGLKHYPLNENMKYFLGLAYYFTNQTSKAKNILNEMEPNTALYHQLKKLLN